LAAEAENIREEIKEGRKLQAKSKTLHEIAAASARN